LGAHFDGGGVNFAVYSSVATKIEVCIFDPQNHAQEIRRFELPEVTGHVWHGYSPQLGPGTLYGLRVHGPYQPEQGHRCNPSKLLIDPYAKAIEGNIDWAQPLLSYIPGQSSEDLAIDTRDSAAGVPKALVLDEKFDWGNDSRPETPWRKTILYEVHLKGFTKRHPHVPEALRGTYAGFASPAAIEHLKKLGVTAVQLLPIHAAANDAFLKAKGLSNYWGYNTLGYFAPEKSYASDQRPGAQVTEFKNMVKTLHLAGIEVILDVVYNHTCEGNHLGPTLSLKGLDNCAYYWLMPQTPRFYLDFTGTGNSVRAASTPAARLIVDSLRYWATEMHVDGFRFDLAATLGRARKGEFHPRATIFQIISQDPVLARLKLIAEPWDVGMGGYQLGNFPEPWRDQNGKYRDAIRRFWKGDENLAGEVGYRLTGSADVYQWHNRRPHASVNFITSHDGFTVRDLVSYSEKHNEANGEQNRDGANDNNSWNCGIEGDTDNPEISALRARQQRNLLATLLVSQGVPLITAGDEMGKTQAGNNNAYAQDNEISWLDWNLDDPKRSLLEFSARMIHFRKKQPVLQRRRFFLGDHIWDSRMRDLAWFRPDGTEMSAEDWQQPFVRSLAFLLGGDATALLDENGEQVVGEPVLVLINAHHEPINFTLPGSEWGVNWEVVTYTGDGSAGARVDRAFELIGRSMAVLRRPSA
jgi:glycogen operon protein